MFAEVSKDQARLKYANIQNTLFSDPSSMAIGMAMVLVSCNDNFHQPQLYFIFADKHAIALDS